MTPYRVHLLFNALYAIFMYVRHGRFDHAKANEIEALLEIEAASK